MSAANFASAAAAGAPAPPVRRWLWAWLGYLGFVVYGSLVPLDFRPMPLEQAWAAFQQIPYLQLGVQSRADWVANGVLYLPLALLGALALSGGRPGVAAALLSLLLATGLAVAVEFTQQFFPPRTVSQNDLLAEGLGSLLGAALSLRVAPWLARAREFAGSQRARVAGFVLPAYAVLWTLHAFFPYDLLVSRAELADKLASGLWGWGAASPEGGSALRTLLHASAETVLAMPLGMALAQWRGTRPAQAALWGAAIGVVVELGQLLIASGLSQGLSVATRAAGLAAGAWAWPRWQRQGSEPARRWIDRQLHWLVGPYLALLAVAAGFGRHAWVGLARAEQSWADLRWQPFYYHYYTTEAEALRSLGSVVLMFVPLALLAWARRSSPVPAALLAGLLAALLELGKLALADIHPDPTNVWIAVATVGLIVRLAPALAMSPLQAAAPAPSAGSPAAPPGRAQALPSPTSPAVATQAVRAAAAHALAPQGLALLVTAVAALAALGWPGVALPTLAAVLLAAGLAAWRPLSVLLVLPLALVMLDFAPWSGRSFVDEFDLVLVVAACWAWARSGPPGKGVRVLPPTVGLAFALFGSSLLLGAGVAAAGAGALDLNALSHPYSPLAGLRIVKGALQAWLFVAVARRLAATDEAVGAWLGAGMALGLAATVAWVAWERLAFVGDLFDFRSDYRVTGPISAMHRGGAYIECWLAVSAAFVAAAVATARRRWVFWGGALLLLAAAYAMLVTYSRNGYAALSLVLAVALLAGLRRAWGQARASLALMALLVLGGAVVAASLPGLAGSFAQERLRQSATDLAVRVAHWQEALSLRGDSAWKAVLGAGVGRFPETHFWTSREPRAASFRLEPGDDNRHLRLGPGATVYVEQIVDPPAGKALNLTLNLRSEAGAPAITVTLCRKWMLTSSECEQAEVKGIVAPGRWQTQDAKIAPLPAPTSVFEALAPIKLSLHTPAKGTAVDVDNVSLHAEGAGMLLYNGSFAAGMDRWFFATDLDPPWHVHSLPVGLLFDQGWFGLLSAGLLAAAAGLEAVRRAWRGSAVGLAALLGLLAFAVSGSLNTLIDAPRFLWLALVLLWLGAAQSFAAPPQAPGSRRPAAPST